MILDAILASKRQELVERQAVRPLDELVEIAASSPPARGFKRALRGPGVALIAEIKRKSPSGGELRADAAADVLAGIFADNGASALSVLTDFSYFGGTDADLLSARTATDLPVLRKDFVVDPYQLYEARALGADAVLLIVRALEQPVLEALVRLARVLGMDALVETHTEDEVRRALAAGAKLVGVNNRDLDTLATDPSLALRLRHLVPPEIVFVAESGIRTPAQLAALASAGVDAVLVGEALARAADPGALLRELAAGASALPLPAAGRGAGLAPRRSDFA